MITKRLLILAIQCKCFQLTGEEGIHEEEHGNEERDDDEVSNDPAAVLRK